MLQVLRVSATYVEKIGYLTDMDHSVGICLSDVCTRAQSNRGWWSTVCSWSILLSLTFGHKVNILHLNISDFAVGFLAAFSSLTHVKRSAADSLLLPAHHLEKTFLALRTYHCSFHLYVCCD